jgi:hypothetical protein
MTVTMTQGQFKAEPSCSYASIESVLDEEVDIVLDDEAIDNILNTAKLNSGGSEDVLTKGFCLGIWLYIPNPWGGWGWWCLGRFV